MFIPASGFRCFKRSAFHFAPVRLLLALGLILGIQSLAAAQSDISDRPVFDVPRIDGIKIDGKFDDWGDKGLIVRTMLTEYGDALDPKDTTGEFRLAWDERGLIIAVRVHDSMWFEEPSATALWHRDSIEVFVADKVGSMNYQQVYIAPGMAADQPKLRHHTIDFNMVSRNGATPPLEAERVAVNANEYTMEILYPWSNLGIKPHQGDEVGFQIYINDVKDENLQRGQKHLVFFPAIMTYTNPLRMHRIRLAANPGPPILASASGPERPKAPVAVRVFVDPSLSGKKIELVDDQKVLGSASIPSASEAQIVPMTIDEPPMDKINHWFTFRVDGVTVGHYRLGDPDRGLSDPVFNSSARESVEVQGGYIGENNHGPTPLIGSVKPSQTAKLGWPVIITGIVIVVLLIAGSGYAIYRAKRLSPSDI